MILGVFDGVFDGSEMLGLCVIDLFVVRQEEERGERRGRERVEDGMVGNILY